VAVTHNRAPLTGLARKLVNDGLLDEQSAVRAFQTALSSKIPFVKYLIDNKLADARIVAQAADIFADAIADARCTKPVATFIGNQGISSSLLAILDAGTDGGGAQFPLLVTTADHPLLTADMVAQFLGDVGDADLAVAMVERQVMLAQFPEAKRTWLRFADGAWSGANLFALTRPAARGALTLWQAAEADRKRPWRLFRHFGWGVALRAITRTIGLADGLARAGVRLGMRAKLVPMADPVAAIDVDKPADHALAEMILLRKDVAL